MNILKSIATFTIIPFILLSGCKKDDDDSKNPNPNPNPNTTTTPKVESKSPLDHAINVGQNKVVSASFNVAMDANSINNISFTLKDGNTPILGLVTYAGLTAIFTPASQLNQNTLYTASITTAVKSTLGIQLDVPITWSFTTGISAVGLAPVVLGTAGNYVILAKTAVNNNPISAITGDIGLSPAATSYITGLALVDATGYATSSQVTGKVFGADMATPTAINLTTAVGDMTTAYNDAAGRSIPDFLELGAGNIGGMTLVSGLYKWNSTVTAPTNVVISGSATDVWIFQISGDLSVSSGVNFILSGGAKPENIYWQVAGEVTLGTTSNFKGVVLCMTGITLKTGVVFTGRALSQTAVILDGNIVTQP